MQNKHIIGTLTVQLVLGVSTADAAKRATKQRNQNKI